MNLRKDAGNRVMNLFFPGDQTCRLRSKGFAHLPPPRAPTDGRSSKFTVKNDMQQDQWCGGDCGGDFVFPF
jgi:hypothetical protein